MKRRIAMCGARVGHGPASGPCGIFTCSPVPCERDSGLRSGPRRRLRRRAPRWPLSTAHLQPVARRWMSVETTISSVTQNLQGSDVNTDHTPPPPTSASAVAIMQIRAHGASPTEGRKSEIRASPHEAARGSSAERRRRGRSVDSCPALRRRSRTRGVVNSVCVSRASRGRRGCHRSRRCGRRCNPGGRFQRHHHSARIEGLRGIASRPRRRMASSAPAVRAFSSFAWPISAGEQGRSDLASGFATRTFCKRSTAR